jgi:prephenate dehydrogenase
MNDEDDFILQNAKIAIIGLGLMGGSFALALKGKCADLLAVVPRQTTRELALRLNIVSQADEDPAKILPQADMIVLSTPIPAIFDWLARLPEYVHRPCVVIDMGSTKQAIVEAMSKLPEQFHAIGGHPICGKENLTLENAEATLYHNAPFVLTPLPRHSARAGAAAFQMIQAIGANPIWIDAAMHDRTLAATSHLPFLLASALVLATPAESAPLVGPGFRSSSRLASTPSSMMMGVMQTNRQNILDAISRLKVNLDLLEQALQSGDSEKIQSILDEACAKHKKFL